MDAEDINDCEKNPNFAIICSFLMKFGDMCGIEKVDFLKLRQMIESKRKVPSEFIQLHITLLRKIRNRSMNAENWEMYLSNILNDFSVKDSTELRKLGYNNCSIALRLRILKFLMESQFDYNVKLRNRINKLNSVDLKTEPIGQDIDGTLYWYNRDNNRNVRVYSQTFDNSWNLISTNLKEGQLLIKNLKMRIGIVSEDCKTKAADELEDKNVKMENEVTESCENGVSDSVDPVASNENDNDLKAEDIDDKISEKCANENDLNCEILSENEKMENAVEFSETIEEPVMLIVGPGDGHDCDMGNPNCVIDEDNISVESVKTTDIEKSIVNTVDKNVVNEEDVKKCELKDLENISESIAVVAVGKTSPKVELVKEDDNKWEENKDSSTMKLNVNDHNEIEMIDVRISDEDANQNGAKIKDEIEIKKDEIEIKKDEIEIKKNEIEIKKDAELPPRRKKGRPRKEKRPRNVAKLTPDGSNEIKPRKSQSKRITMIEIEDTDNEEEERQALLQKLSSSSEIVKKIRSMGLNLDDVDVLKSVSSILNDSSVNDRPVRQSRRLAQIKIREVASSKKHSNEIVKKSSKKVANNKTEVDKMQKNVNKSGKKAKNTKTYLISSSDTNTEVDFDDYEINHDVEDDEWPELKSDHEFSPESDLMMDEEYVPLRHARTACKTTKGVTGYEDTACEKCNEKTNPDKILLCDKCDKGWHCDCITPPLHFVPAGDWFCPPCQHIMLIEKLEIAVEEMSKMIKKHELEERRKERLAYVGISLSNVLPPPKKVQKKEYHSYQVYDNDDDDYENSEDSAFETNVIGSRESLASTPDSDSSSSRTDSLAGTRSKHKNCDGINEDRLTSKSDKKSNKRVMNDRMDYANDERSYRLRERRKTKANYVFNEYDNMIKSAIADEMKTVVKTSSDNLIDNKAENESLECNGSEKPNEEENNNNDDYNPRLITPVIGRHKKKRRTFQDLDSNEEDDEMGENDEEFEVASESAESDELSASIESVDEDEDDFINDSNESDSVSNRRKTIGSNKKRRNKDDYHYGFRGLRRSSRVRKTRYDFRGNLSSGSEEEDVRTKKQKRILSSDENSERNSDPDADFYNPEYFHQSKSKEIKFPRLEIPFKFRTTGIENSKKGAKKRKRIVTRSSSSENDSQEKHSKETDKNSSSNSETDVDNTFDNVSGDPSYSGAINTQANEIKSNVTKNAINVQKDSNLKTITDELSYVKNEYCSISTPISAAKHLFSGTNIIQTAYTTTLSQPEPPQPPQQNLIVLQTSTEADDVEPHDEHRGEFGGLVSYFSSQCTEALDS